MTSADDTVVPQLRTWLDANWNEADRKPRVGSRREWLQLVYEAGWIVPRWPPNWGGLGLPEAQADLIERELRRVGAPGLGADRTNIPANVLLEFASEDLAREFVPGLIIETISWCLLYSEPGAGSDLAALRTRADRRGKEWVFNGQKVWTSGAGTADYGLLLARTDWDVPKHQGISFFFVPMRQPGIIVRPLHQITGDSHFNEVFLNDAVAPAGNIVGGLNGGWQVLQKALSYERALMGEGASEKRQGSAANNKLDLIALARQRGKLKNHAVRQEIAQAVAWRRLNELNLARARSEVNSGGSSILSLAKLAMSRILHNDARVARMVLGAEGLLDDPRHPAAADMNYRSLNAYMNSIGGGTDQIQRNIIGERLLGLPREVETDRGLPFRESLAVRR